MPVMEPVVSSRIVYFNNFSVDVTVAKPPGTSVFTVPFTLGPPLLQPFANAAHGTAELGTNGYVNNALAMFSVPLTLVDAAGVVKAVGHALKWDVETSGQEQYVIVDYALTQANAVVGDSLHCRAQADHMHFGVDSYYRSEAVFAPAHLHP